MTKARTLADFISDGGPLADGTISVSEVSGAAPIESPTFTGAVALDAISATIANTAVDIFVYDTSKDSDGGAWRKRTQHTSWYNETLNTATRGSRREFPAVAVIVAETTKVTIYDGDDPALPMWMVFNQNGSYLGWTPATSITALNGQICRGSNNGSNTGEVYNYNFVKDEMYLSDSTAWNRIRTGVDITIASRNLAGNGAYTRETGGLVSGAINDVAITVLPNAPIDPASGLPVPTIAVATAGGVSVIKDDGTVVDSASTSVYYSVMFNGTELYGEDTTYADDTQFFGDVGSLSDNFPTLKNTYSYSPTNERLSSSTLSKFSGNILSKLGEPRSFAVGLAADTASSASWTALNMVAGHADKAERTALVSYINSSFNTGWMNGDIKLATLSDTDATNVTGSELVTNGTFDTDFSGWTIVAGASYLSISGGIAVSDTTSGSGGVTPTIEQVITTEVGKTYTISVTGLRWTAGNWTMITLDGTSIIQDNNGSTDVGNYYDASDSGHYTFTASKTSYTLGWRSRADNTRAELNSISVRLAEEDRSVNGNGLQVFGTVTKSAVATGADLVGYSPSTTVSNFTQPYNSDLDFGTGDFVFSIWLKQGTGTTVQSFISRGDTAALGNRINNFLAATTREWTIFINGTSRSTSYVPPANTWVKLDAVRRNGVIYAYANGELVYLASEGGSLTNSSAVTVVGGAYTGTQGSTDCSLALARISATAPSAEQIKKIYEDEKVLFQENAAATLYGTSDAVTALAYDDSTNLLHVGTSAGRSVFQGLKRVDNTTTAVGAAISASNGLVADE